MRNQLLRRGQVWLIAAASGGSLLALEGCDPAVRNTVLNGVGSAATGLSATFIQAFIQSLQGDGEGEATTVLAPDLAPEFYA